MPDSRGQAGAAGAIRLRGGPEGKRHPDQGQQAESGEAEQFALEDPHVAGNQLERVELRQEIPFGADAGGSGGEGVGLFTEFPGKDGGQRAEQGQHAVPHHQFPQEEVGEELHVAQVLRREVLGSAHAVPSAPAADAGRPVRR